MVGDAALLPTVTSRGCQVASHRPSFSRMRAATFFLAVAAWGCGIESSGLAGGGDAGPRADGSGGPDGGAENSIGDDAFDDFAAGDLGRSAANLYVRHDGAVAPVLSWDANDDGHPDIVVPFLFDEPLPTASRVYLGMDGGFDPGRYVSLETTSAVHPLLSDLDGDGHTDVAFTSHSSVASFASQSVIHWGSGEGFTRRTFLPTFAARAIEAADLDRDGWLDVIVTSYTFDYATLPGVYVYWGGPDGYDELRRTEILGATEIIDVCVADFDEDGALDLFFARFYSHMMARRRVDSQLVRFTGREPEAPVLFPTTGASGCAVADVDGDDDLDVVVTQWVDDSSFPQPALIFHGDAGPPSPAIVELLPVLYTGRPKIADFDRNGWLDVLAPVVYDGIDYDTLTPIFFGGDTGLEPSPPLLQALSPYDADVRDFDTDGYPDVLLTGYGTGPMMPDTPQQLYGGSSAGPVAAADVLLPGSRTLGMPSRDWGHTWSRGEREHFVSRALDAGDGPRVLRRVAWTARTPSRTRVRLQLRSADTVAELAAAPWTGPEGSDGTSWYSGSPSDVHASHAGHRYVQYRAELLFSAAGGPTLESVTITYE